MTVERLRQAVRRAASAPARRVGENAWEARRVSLVERDDDAQEYLLAVTVGPSRFEVHLWPEDLEWECDCDAGDAGCAHAVAAVEALRAGLDQLERAEAPPRLAVLLRAHEGWLHLGVAVRRGEALVPFPQPGVQPGPLLTHLMRLSADWAGDRVPSRLYRALLVALVETEDVELDGGPVRPSKIPLDVVARVQDTGAGWRLELQDPPEVEQVFEGDPTLVLAGGVLRPRGFGRLSELQRHQLSAPLLFARHELPRLTAEWLPALSKAVRVERSAGIPVVQQGGLRTILALRGSGPVLEATARLVYGDPPVAEVRGEELLPLGGLTSLPPRNRRLERELITGIHDELGLRPGQRLRLEGEGAARFVDGRLPRFSGQLEGGAETRRFEIVRAALVPEVEWSDDSLHVRFCGGGAVVGADRVLEAWRRGDSLVSLAGGGYAPIPVDWLGEHGDLLEAASGRGRHLAPAAARLMEDSGVEPPPDLRGLVDALRRGGPEELPPPGTLQAELRDYQLAGYRWLRFLGEQGLGGVLADDMGLGKTVQALAALLADRGSGPSLVVAPTSVLHNWEAEAGRFAPELSLAILHGAGRDRVDIESHDLLITSYALLRLDVERLEAIDFRTVVLDEAQAIKNPDSQTARAARRLSAGRRLALTGTPIENHLRELWSLFEFLMPGFFGSRRRFDERFGPGSPEALMALRARVRPFVLRRLKSEVATELPPRTETVLRCPLSEPQRAAYEALRTGAGGLRGRIAILALLTRLRQAACDAALLPDTPAEVASGKLDVLLDALTEVADEGCRALVFSQWTSLLDRVEPRLEQAGLEWTRLDGSTRDRRAVVDRFQDPDGPPVFLISLKAGGTGLNLTAADHVFHLDPWWNPATEQQAVGRAHRIGQDKPVFVWKLVSAGTVEERVLALQERKRALAGAVLEGQDGAATLDDGELLALIG